MPTSPTPQRTDFSLDILGRYVCNGLDEALRSANPAVFPNARPFDIIVVGAGSFGSILTQHLFSGDTTHSHRILVLDAGPLALPEHVQNLPMLGLTAPGPIEHDPGALREQVWGLAWLSNVKGGFPGLAYCLGGRSVFWGGWSPQLLDTTTDTEMPRPTWPASLVDDLNGRYFREASEQIGVTETNDFIHGALHRALRRQLKKGIDTQQVTDAIPLDDLPQHLDNVPAGQENLFKLEAPLAVQGRPPRSGFFAINKFSAVPVLMAAARKAWAETVQGQPHGTPGDDAKKRLMVVPNCRVIRLIVDVQDGTAHVTGVLTSQGFIPLPPHGVVVIALGTIESARLALLSFGGIANYHLIGANLMAHLRSNLTIRFPRAALASLDHDLDDLQQSALFVKGRHSFADGSAGYFHLQITASAGGGGLGTNSDDELFQKVPDIDLLNAYRAADRDHVVATIRSIGETQPQNPNSRITLALDQPNDEAGVPRAFVSLADPREPAGPGDSPQTVRDRELWAAMDQAADEVAQVFAAGHPFEVLERRRDGMGTTHHEAGPLWIGDRPATSVTNPDGRLHCADNAYVAGPALFPTVGSPNPMLTGTALARRTADRVLAQLPHPVAAPLEDGYAYLFDGTEVTFRQWHKVGPGTFALIDGAMVAEPAPDFGLLFYAARTFGDCILRLEFRLHAAGDNSGVFVRFRYPLRQWTDLTGKEGIDRNAAWVAVHTGFEVQIDDQARPDGAALHRTGAIYKVEIGPELGKQVYQRPADLAVGQWNTYEIEVHGDQYTVRLNNQQTTTFTNTDATRGKAPLQDPFSGYLGVQAHTGPVAFRNIRIKPL